MKSGKSGYPFCSCGVRGCAAPDWSRGASREVGGRMGRGKCGLVCWEAERTGYRQCPREGCVGWGSAPEPALGELGEAYK